MQDLVTCSVDEPRDDWRGLFFSRLLPLVENASSTTEAALILNKEIWNIWGIVFRCGRHTPCLTMTVYIR